MIDLIRKFRIAISNILLYPSESEVVKSSLARCNESLVQLLEGSDALTISESEGKLLENGKPLEVDGGIFLKLIRTCNIKSITFKTGITQAELHDLLRSLSTKQKPKNSPYIEINEKVYVPVSEKDIVIEKGKEAERIFQIMDELSEFMASLQDEEAKDKVKSEIMKRLGILPKFPEPLQKEAREKIILKPELRPIKQVEELLEKDSFSLLQDDVVQELPALFKNLHTSEEFESASKLCNKLAANLEATVTDTRLKAVISFKKLYFVLESLNAPHIVRNLDAKLLSAGRRETNGKIYQGIAELLGSAARRYLKEEDYAETSNIIKMLGEHAKAQDFEERKKYAKTTIDKLVGGEFTRLLVDDLSSPDKERREKAFSILLDVGEPCVPYLIQKIKHTVDFRLRKVVCDLLVKIGASAINQLMEALKEEASPMLCIRILELVGEIGYEVQVIDALRKKLAHPEFQIRRKVVDVLYQIKSELASEVLLEAVDDESHLIRGRAIEYIGDLHYNLAVTKLLEILDKEKKESVEAVICETLGKLGNPQAIPVLFKLASPKTIFHTGKSREVRISAIKALHLLGDKRVRNFINDKDPFAQKVAREIVKD